MNKKEALKLVVLGATLTIIIAGLVIGFLVSALWCGVALAAFLVVGYILLTLAYKQAKKSHWPFTMQPEATLCHKVRGKGRPRAILSKKGFKVDAEGKIVADPLWIIKGLFKGFLGGLMLVSFWPHVRIRHQHFMWFNFNIADGSLTKKEADVQFWPVKRDLYGFEVAAIDQNKMTVTVRGYVDAMFVHAYKPFFERQNWLEALIRFVMSAILEFVSNTTYAAMADDPKAVGSQIFLKMQVAGEIDKYKEDEGVEIFNIGIIKPIISPDDQKTLEEPWRAGQEALAITIKATAEKTATITRAEGELEARKTIANGQAAALATLAEAIKNHPEIRDVLLAQIVTEGGGGDNPVGLSILLPLLDKVGFGLARKSPAQPRAKRTPTPAKEGGSTEQKAP